MMINTSLFLATLPGQPTSIGWLFPFPAWAWVLIVLGSGLSAWWLYRSTEVPVAARWSLGLLRATLIVFMFILLSGPVLETPIPHRTNDQVLVMIDRSGSLQMEDVPSDSGEVISRNEQVIRLLQQHDETWGLVNRDRSVHWIGFHGHPFLLDHGDPTTMFPDIPPPTGRRTDIPESINQAIQDTTPDPISAVVLLSDGRTSRAIPPGFTAMLESRGIPIMVVPLGSPGTTNDIGIRSTFAPQHAYVGDHVPVIVQIEKRGDTTARISGDVVLEDLQTGEELDRVPLDEAGAAGEYTLIGEQSLEGEASWRVRLDTGTQDLVEDNNSADIMITLLDQPLRVLYIEGVPRWEYRYLKNLLVREGSVDSSVMLLSADREFAQEGNLPITRLPSSQKEFLEYDVVIIGDLPAGALTTEQASSIEKLVAEGSIGLVWIGGERWTPSSWGESTLSNLLPFTSPYTLPITRAPVHMEPTDEALRIGVLQISDTGTEPWPDILSEPGISWSAFNWSQVFTPEQIKPTAEALATVVERNSDPGRVDPIILGMRYGAGRTMYLATDEIWRWRHGRGERLYEQFWIQFLRSLARTSDDIGINQARLRVSPREATIQQPVRLELKILDTTLLPHLEKSVNVELHSSQGGRSRKIELVADDRDPSRYLGSWIPLVAGRSTIRMELPLTGGVLEEDLLVLDPSDEYRNPLVDHGLLERLAVETGGQIVPPGSINQLPDLLPDRSITTIEIRRGTIWDTPWLFMVAMGLLLFEWVGRRWFRLA